MKRKEQILAVSLALFNAEGEATVTAVDIANELDISPGNLYYHFKGKEELVAALFVQFETGVRTLLDEALLSADARDSWLALYVLLEHQYDYRFLHRDGVAMLRRYPAIARRFHTLLAMQQALLAQFLAAAGVSRPEELGRQMLLTINYWLELQELLGLSLDRYEAILSTMAQMTVTLLPHVNPEARAVMEECQELYRTQFAGDS